MPLWKNTQHSFAAGQLDTHVMGRQDMDKYAHGATLLKNFLVKRQGCISKRRGTDLTANLDGLLGTAYDGTPITPNKMRLVPVTNGDDGRYVILSHGLCFVASRDGILAEDATTRLRSIAPYIGEDADGKTVVIGGKDVRYSTETPVDLIHRAGAGNYTVTRCASLAAAFSSAADGDTVRLHNNLLCTSSATLSGSKTVTLDLYGYKITFHGTNGHVNVSSASASLTVTSSRTGASVVVTGSGSDIFAFKNSSGSSAASGSITLAGDIEYHIYADGSANGIVYADKPTAVTVTAGTFENHTSDTIDNSFIRMLNGGGPLTITGGSFINRLAMTSSKYFKNIYASGQNITISGGEFVNASSTYSSFVTSSSSYIVFASNSKVTIAGGRFTFASSYNLVSQIDKRGGTFWSNEFLRIVRGEFSMSVLHNTYAPANDTALSEYLADGSVMNEAQPNADGFYGAKVDGEADYTYTHMSNTARPYRIAIPYADADLADLCIRQSGDTLFIAHRDYPPAKITFDRTGYAYFEELTLDNTDHQPPVVESATMVGNDPKETDNWPAEFTTPPSWLDSAQKSAVTAFKNACLALGTVTDAGFSGNKADGSDGSCSYACSYTCTSVSVNHTTGKKTTTVSVKSFTKTITKEETTAYTDGLATGSTTKTITTGGSAENSASATSVIVTRTVRYVATYVKDGRESRPSAPVAVDYDMPWANNAVVNITIGKGANGGEPEYYNVYKDNGNGYGLIATVGVDRIAGGISGAVDTYPLFMPDNTKATAALVCAADHEENKGWATGDILRKMVSSGKDSFTTSPANDICLITTASNASNGIRIDFPSKTRFDRIRLMLDGRIYDKETDASYIIVSSPAVTANVTYWKNDGTTGTISKSVSSAISYAYGGITGGWMEGIYADWVGLQYKRFTAPNGDMVYGWLYGKGDCTDDFNSHLRSLDIDLSTEFKNATGGFAGVKSIKFTFSTSVYSYWTNNQQGCIHAIHFYSGGTTSDGGVVQDDYINPDMTVTPPDDTQDAHFSAADEYPGCVGIYEQRLVFASTRSSPSTIWMSRIADLYNFTVHESIREDDALELTLAATEFPNINHLVMGRDLMLFGDGGEWLISPVSGNALTYKTASAKLQSMIGSDRALQPLQLADETLFAERGGTCLRSINYNYTSDSYQSNDLSVIAQSLFRANAIVSMAYKQHPDSIVECVLADGRVGTLVYMKEQEVAAWSVQELGGGWKAREIVTPKCILNGTTEMMLLVEKDGVYQMWRVRDDIDELVAAKQVVLDGLHVERTSATATDEVAVALGDGNYAVGFPVVSEFVSVRPEPEKGATAQMEIKNATESEIRVIDATTFSVKPYAIETGWREVTLPVGRNGTAVTLAEKDCKRLLTGTNNRDGRIHLRHAEPWQLTILSISNTYQVEYENEQAKGDGQ